MPSTAVSLILRKGIERKEVLRMALQMKRLCITAVLFLYFVGTVGCGSNVKETSPSGNGKNAAGTMAENEQVALLIENEKLTARSARLTMRNNSDSDISFGAMYCIQTYNHDSWNDIDIGMPDWTAELYVVVANTSYTFDIDWYALYGELSSGKYRIVKEYKLADSMYSASCEFDIN